MGKMDFAERAKELVSQMTLAEKMSQMRYDAPAIERLGIPAYNWWNECLHGVARAGAATVFPQAIAMAASFDEELLFEVARTISDEARAKYNEYRKFGYTEIYQGLTFWSPNINIFRDPRWGRGHETYGEDPYLTAVLGTAFVRGLQGDDPVYRKLDATLKHFAVHSGPEGLRHSFDAHVSKKDLYETYLWAFRYCVRHAAPAAVMGAYNRVEGEPCCASKTLLENILRGEMEFKGYVVSDCGAICDINRNHRVTENEAESAALAVKNGCDLNCGSAYQYLQAAAAQGLIGEEEITRAVERLMEARLRLGLFAEDCPFDSVPYSVVECPEHLALSRRMAEESIVLLKNDGILPFGKDVRSVAVIGPNAADIPILLGNYNGTPSKTVTLLEGIQQSGVTVYYAKGCDIAEDSVGEWAEHPLHEALLAARRSDAVILCMGLNPSMEGEEGDAYNGARSGDKADLELPLSQKRLLEAVLQEGKPTVFVNVSGSAVNLSRADEACGAVVQCFYPGAEGGAALADILFGRVSPSGRLPVTFYRSADDLPGFEDYSMRGRTYRYFEGEALYPFGHGLSYVPIEYLSCTVEREAVPAGEAQRVFVRLRNAGEMDAREAVLLFIRDRNERGVCLPQRRLAGFKKVEIPAGGEKEVWISIPPDLMAYTDEDGRERLEEGTYEVETGAAAGGISLKASFRLV